jgi:hypothetical protein
MGDSRQAMGPRQAESSARPLVGKSKAQRMRTFYPLPIIEMLSQ